MICKNDLALRGSFDMQIHVSASLPLYSFKRAWTGEYREIREIATRWIKVLKGSSFLQFLSGKVTLQREICRAVPPEALAGWKKLSSSEKGLQAPFVFMKQELSWASKFHFFHIARTQEFRSETLMPDECIFKIYVSRISCGYLIVDRKNSRYLNVSS